MYIMNLDNVDCNSERCILCSVAKRSSLGVRLAVVGAILAAVALYWFV